MAHLCAAAHWLRNTGLKRSLPDVLNAASRGESMRKEFGRKTMPTTNSIATPPVWKNKFLINKTIMTEGLWMELHWIIQRLHNKQTIKSVLMSIKNMILYYVIVFWLTGGPRYSRIEYSRTRKQGRTANNIEENPTFLSII